MFRSRQRKHGGGKFKSEDQRRWMWANRPRAARKWAHNRSTNKTDWIGKRGRPSVRGFLRGSRSKGSSRKGGLRGGGRKKK